MTLRDKFFKECTDLSNNSGAEAGLRKINMTPHNLFEWFKKNMQGEALPMDSVSQRSELLAFKDWFNNLPDESDDRLYITDKTIDRFKANCG